MEQEYVTVAVHEEFAKRMEDQNTLQNARITALEKALQEIGRITIEVGRLASSMENMAKEQEKQGQRLEKLEEKPAKRWDAVITGIIGAVVGALGAALMSGVMH